MYVLPNIKFVKYDSMVGHIHEFCWIHKIKPDNKPKRIWGGGNSAVSNRACELPTKSHNIKANIFPQTGSILGDIVIENMQFTRSVTHSIYSPSSCCLHNIRYSNFGQTRL